MNIDELLEWTMGWPWPVIIVLSILMAWGIGRVLTWEDEEGKDNSSDQPAGRACVCRCG